MPAKPPQRKSRAAEKREMEAQLLPTPRIPGVRVVWVPQAQDWGVCCDSGKALDAYMKAIWNRDTP
jgi:hypothetical protein